MLYDDMYAADFPRLKDFLDIHFNHRPEVCTEKPSILTDWFRENGFENQKDGSPWEPVLRQGYAYKNLMEKKRPMLGKNDLLAGTTTTKEIGVVIYPDASASLLWGELLTIQDPPLNPYNIGEEEIERLNSDILPYWNMRNTNAGFSLGRMDQWLQPYFEADMKTLETEEEKEEYIRYALDLVGSFYMRCTDHLPMIPDIGNHLFGGSSSDQAITLACLLSIIIS